MSTATGVLYNFRVLSALRSDDPAQLQPFLDEAANGTSAQTGALLDMAVRVGTIPIIQSILALPNIDINAPTSEGTKATALHAAAESGRVDAVLLLLSQPKINDTIRDEHGRTVLEAAATPEVASIVEDSRTRLQSLYLHRLAAYIASPLSNPEEGTAMAGFLGSPRAEILNLNTLDEKSGTSLLHESARRRDVRLVELAVKNGADVFLRDKRGKRVLEGEKSPDERIKAFLRQFANQEGLVHAKSDGTPPDLRGYLSKWTNYKSGWRTRWFVLENGILSYYRQREDEPVACRGSIAMAVAVITPSSDNSRFELHSKASSSVPKIMVKSAHRGEIARWVQAVKLNIEYYSKPGRQTASKLARGSDMSSTLNALPPTDNFLNPGLVRSTTAISGASIAGLAPSRYSPSNVNEPDNMSIFEAGDDRSIITSGDNSAGIPHEAVFDMGVINIRAQLELTTQLVDSLYLGPSSPEQSVAMQRTPSRQQAIKEALRESLSTLATLVSQQQVMTQDRERYLLSRIDREIEARKLWEENMLTVAKQQEEMDRQLTEAAHQNERKKRALKQARGVLEDIAAGSSPNTPGIDDTLSSPHKPLPVPPSASTVGTSATGDSFTTARTRGQSFSISNIQEVNAALAEADSDDEEDEFFDAIETGIPNLRQYESIANPEKERPGTPTASGAEKKLELPAAKSDGTIKGYLKRESLLPYHGVRNKLPIDDDKRPAVSLWGILKSSVGKDLTKISFPVSFNECTSMLQRMAEDMEYDACLTVAASEEDSLRRIAFVAAFAMSNYSSTIGRIAKPFNPLLSQSFEYAIPNRYRYISEQVSHHPPISACYSEAPTWKYYGEVDAQNKFQGRSFEIKPTGVAHADLIIPRKWVKAGLDYPDAGAEYEADHVAEHYSWKKVTTNISNFIMGNPIIDHYGDLVVTNHRTGETCTLTFKPRTWRGKDAMEIKGQVQDSAGHAAWDIAGRWDTQLIARASSARSAPLDVDTHFEPAQKEYLLLWRNSEKQLAPFNLTPFAVTLNDIPTGLKPYLCPTDCRLRTDQRAFENANYDRAQELKTANEDRQRNTRNARAQGKLPSHEPRWFKSLTDPDSGERMWAPKRDESKGEVLFWSEREKAPKSWEGVDHIFVED